MKDLGEISRYLGLDVERTETSFTYHVAPYIAELVAQYLTDDTNPPVLSSADPGCKTERCEIVGSYVDWAGRPIGPRAGAGRTSVPTHATPGPVEIHQFSLVASCLHHTNKIFML